VSEPCNSMCLCTFECVRRAAWPVPQEGVASFFTSDNQCQDPTRDSREYEINHNTIPSILLDIVWVKHTHTASIYA